MKDLSNAEKSAYSGACNYFFGRRMANAQCVKCFCDPPLQRELINHSRANHIYLKSLNLPAKKAQLK